MLSLHDALSHSMYGFSECEQTLIQGRANINLGNEDWQETLPE